MKRFLAGFATAYTFAGFMIGESLAHFVPATNFLGVCWLALIWPLWLAQPWTGWTPPVPAWSWTFH